MRTRTLVILAALAAVLKRHGLPDNLVGVIETWLLNRSARVQVNGNTTDPVPTAMGLGQGDAHSCVLYTIFINSLAKFLRASGHDLGITSSGTLARVQTLVGYFSSADAADAAWALHVLLGKQGKRMITGRRLREICLAD